MQHSQCSVLFEVSDEDLWQTHSTLQSVITAANKGDVIVSCQDTTLYVTWDICLQNVED